MRGKRIITMVHVLLNMRVPTAVSMGALTYINGHNYNPTELITRPQMRGQQHRQHDPEGDSERFWGRARAGSNATNA